ncbi:uncharacterized protein METZ01_LOCUS298452, partial [marine metagenome]
YRPAAGTFEFEPNDYSKEFVVELLDDGSLENNEVFVLALENLEGGAVFGGNSTATVMIVDNEASNAPSGVLDVGYNTGVGFNGSVRDLELMPDGRLILAGIFDRFNNMSANSIARLSSKGEMDPIFNPGTGPNGAINVVKLFQGQYLLIGGEFTEFNGKNYNHLVRINLDGVVDDTFNIGSAASGVIMDIDVDSADRIIVVGDFTRFDVIKCQNIIRLNPDGQIDSTFDSGIGAVGIVNSVSVQPDDRIVIAGDFSLYNGSPVGGISRLNVDGSLDKGFNDALPAIELTDHIFSRVEVLEDGRILAAGSVVASVEEEGGASRTYRGVLRLNRDGSVDTTFQPNSSILLADPHYGPNGNIEAMSVQPDGYVLLGGEFTKLHGKVFNR